MIEVAKTSQRQRLWLALRIALGLLLVAFIIRSIDLTQLVDAFARVQLGGVLFLIGLALLAVYVSTLRWRFLLDAQGVHISVWKLFNFYMVSQFFRMIIPGTFTSDIFRVVDIRQSTQKTAVGVASILVERVTGVFVLCGAGTVAALTVPKLDNYPSIRLLTVALFLASSVAMLLLLYPFPLRLLRRVVKSQRLNSFIEQLEAATQFYRTKPLLIPKTLLYSGVIQTIGMVAFYVQIAVFDLGVPFIEAVAIAPIAIVATLIPISPGALGLQEGVYIVLMGMLGVDSADALAAALIGRFVQFVVGLWGGGYYFFYR
jgi:uncharacterized protein (TIRG00374 family)